MTVNTNTSATHEPTIAELMAQLAELKKQNEELAAAAAARASATFTVKLSDKGGLSVYGLGRFPVTLYKAQWLRLIANIQMVADFIKAHSSELKDAPTAEERAANKVRTQAMIDAAMAASK